MEFNQIRALLLIILLLYTIYKMLTKFRSPADKELSNSKKYVYGYYVCRLLFIALLTAAILLDLNILAVHKDILLTCLLLFALLMFASGYTTQAYLQDSLAGEKLTDNGRINDLKLQYLFSYSFGVILFIVFMMFKALDYAGFLGV